MPVHRCGSGHASRNNRRLRTRRLRARRFRQGAGRPPGRTSGSVRQRGEPVNAARKNLWTAILAGWRLRHSDCRNHVAVDRFVERFHQQASLNLFHGPHGDAGPCFWFFSRSCPATDQWRRPFSELPRQSGSARSTLIVMSPDEALTETEAAILDRWIASGGQLILVTNKEWRIRKPRKSEKPAKEEDEFVPQGYLARHGLQPKADVSGENADRRSHHKKYGRRSNRVRIRPLRIFE